MGRPVVTLAGDRHSSRVGASLLGAVGKAEWVARTEAEYVAIAARLAADRQRLAKESAGLRDAMLASPLLDHRAHAGAFGAALRECWAGWCAGEGRAAPAEPAELASV